MSSQLQADIIRAFAAACEQVKAYELGAPDLIDDVMRLIDGTLRFVEPDLIITEARRTLFERLGSTMLLIDRVMDRDIPAAGEGRSYPAVETSRAHAIEAIDHLRATVLEHGRVNAAGDRVGLGREGEPLQ